MIYEKKQISHDIYGIKRFSKCSNGGCMKIKKTGTLIFSVLTAASLFLSACGNNNIPEAGTEAVQTTEAAEQRR